MRELLPKRIRDEIAAQYESAVAMACEGFPSVQHEEDAATGGLGELIRTTVKGELDGYRWRTTWTKFRGRGPGALEKSTGADGIFEIRVLSTDGTVLGQKALPFQAKKEWAGRDGRLLGQLERIVRVFGDGLVVNYREDEYTGSRATDVIRANGDPRALAERQSRSLADVLGGDFIDCRIGRRGVYYDASRQRVVVADDEGRISVHPFFVGERTRTDVREARRH